MQQTNCGVYWRCSQNWSLNCKARGKLYRDGRGFVLTHGEHNHEAPQNFYL